MFRNHLKLIWRHLINDRQFTILNLIGLSTGLACVFLIWLWVNDERQVGIVLARGNGRAGKVTLEMQMVPSGTVHELAIYLRAFPEALTLQYPMVLSCHR